MFPGCALSALVGRLANMPIPGTGGIHHDLVRQPGSAHLMQHHRFGTRRTADVAQAHKTDGDSVHQIPASFGFSELEFDSQHDCAAPNQTGPRKTLPNYTKDSVCAPERPHRSKAVVLGPTRSRPLRTSAKQLLPTCH